MTHSKQIAEKVIPVSQLARIILSKFSLVKMRKGTRGDFFDAIEPILTQALQTAERRGRLFNEQELEIMCIDYKSLVSTTKMMNRQVVGDKKLEFILDANDQVREEILAKLEPYMPASLKPTSEDEI